MDASQPPRVRVLVVDDEPQIRKALSVNLRARGYDVELAADGEQALQMAAAHHPDIVLLDLGLPGLDGTEVIRGLRGWTGVPIIVLSVREAERDKVAALDAGADDYVTKPFGMDELLARLRAALRRARPVAEEAVIETPDFTVDLTAKRVTAGRRRGAPDADRMGHPRGARPQAWAADHAAPAPPAGLGPAVREGDELPPRRTWPSCAASSNRTRAGRATSSRSRAWAIASRLPSRTPD